MGIVQKNLENDFDQVVPGAASKGAEFLENVKARSTEAGLGLDLSTVTTKATRKTEARTSLRGTIAFGSFRQKVPFVLEVFADPIGSTLHTGWTLTSQKTGTMFQATKGGRRHAELQDRTRGNPDVQRKLAGITSAFQATVFTPALQDLVDGLSQSGSEGRSAGFFGA